MAKSRKSTPSVPKEGDALIVDRVSFKAKLIERIEIGKEIRDRSVTNTDELEKNDTDFYKWNDYNSEYLKQAFNNEESQYKYQYDHVNTYVGMFAADRSPNEKLRRLKEYVTNKVNFLENCWKKDINLKSRARQNVVLELGYFIGKLGRDRVLPLYSEGVELPSDIHGLLYIPIDKADTWKFALVKELKAAGYTVDANSIL